MKNIINQSLYDMCPMIFKLEEETKLAFIGLTIDPR